MTTPCRNDPHKLLDYSRRHDLERVHEEHPRQLTRVYIGPRSKHAHLVEDSFGLFPDALCGARARGRYQSWYGTGTFAESQHAARLPLCPQCSEIGGTS